MKRNGGRELLRLAKDLDWFWQTLYLTSGCFTTVGTVNEKVLSLIFYLLDRGASILLTGFRIMIQSLGPVKFYITQRASKEIKTWRSRLESMNYLRAASWEMIMGRFSWHCYYVGFIKNRNVSRKFICLIKGWVRNPPACVRRIISSYSDDYPKRDTLDSTIV